MITVFAIIAIILLFAAVATGGTMFNRYQAERRKKAILDLLAQRGRAFGSLLYITLIRQGSRMTMKDFVHLVRQLEAEGRIKGEDADYLGKYEVLARWYSYQPPGHHADQHVAGTW